VHDRDRFDRRVLTFFVSHRRELPLPTAVRAVHLGSLHSAAWQRQGRDVLVRRRGRAEPCVGRLRYRQAKHRYERSSHGVFAVLAQTMATGKKDADMPVRRTLDLVPQQAVYGRSCQSEEGNVRLRYRTYGRVDHRRRQLQRCDMQYGVLVGCSGRRVL